MIIQLLFSDPLVYFMAAVSITLALTVHEYAHAQAADFLGDHTARDLGRLTVNPLAHLDPIGALLIFTIGFGWGRPVPSNILNIKDKRWGPAMIAAAGPGANFLMAILVAIVLRLVGFSNPGLARFFLTFIWLNVLLGVFNLIPVPPLDGSHLLFAFLGRKADAYRIALLRGGVWSLFLAILFMMYFGIPFIVEPILKLFNLIVGGPVF